MCDKWAARVVSVQGNVEVRRVGATQWQPVRLNDTYCVGDVIRVQERSRASLSLTSETLLRLNQNSEITLGEFKEERTSLVDLLKGAAHFLSRKPRSLEVRTPFAIAGVRGTEFFIGVEEDKAFLSIFEGNVLAENPAGSLALTSGQSAVAEAGKAPVLRVVIRPRDAVNWALYYPPVIFRPEEVPEDTRDPRFLVYRASKLLTVGQVDDASADLERAMRLEPNYSSALALRSIIAVVQNEKDRALDFARKAVEANPNSAAARIALSYAHQARFDLRGARESLEDAVKLEPENALAWARLADIRASFGELSQSLEAAKNAVALDPNLSLTQTVLGFAYLTKVKIDESKAAFEKAIGLDQAASLPRLGLGLAKIRDGDLQEGAREIEIAASLDPNNSLIRSYLGKAYYEQKRTNLDGPEYEIAKQLDPQDPTPWFYDALRKQTTNRPVEALGDMERAIELNDNRAVFRSKLQLDSDLAARSSSLARIYNNLGFQQLGLVEGWKSVNTDPSNFSAHRFLADSYSALPRHEIARVSELLQSQLLQPINITPIQPLLAESNLLLISSQGPAALSLNEFNPLFNRNMDAVQPSVIVGNNDTVGAEAVASGIHGRYSYSVGGTHFETDGFRENNDQEDTVLNGFLQVEASYKTSVQAEVRYRNIENGDLQLRFFEDDFRPYLRQDDTTNSIRLGFRHAFSPGSVFIGNFQYSNGDREVQDEVPEISLQSNLKGDDDAYSAELSYLFRSERFNFVAGGGYFYIDSDEKDTIEFTIPEIVIPPPFPGLPPIVIPSQTVTDTTRLDLDVNHANLYLYSYVNLLDNLTLTVGASGDFYDRDLANESEDQFNPKFGITWNPFQNTTLRGAVFRTLKRTLITDQTLEPTQVAGFNQFFDDDNATKAWVYGGAVDQKFTQSLYGGVEFTYRDMEVPAVELVDPPEVFEVDWYEKQLRAYLFWTPHKWVALSAEYLYEDFERNEENADGAESVETHYVPLGIRFFHPSGVSASLTGTYVDQEGRFERVGATRFQFGSDDFWLFDAALSYRFPKRFGFLTVGVTNLFDEEFQYFDTDRNNPRFQPDRFVFARVTFALP